jgi:hypothetical protein
MKRERERERERERRLEKEKQKNHLIDQFAVIIFVLVVVLGNISKRENKRIR